MEGGMQTSKIIYLNFKSSIFAVSAGRRFHSDGDEKLFSSARTDFS